MEILVGVLCQCPDDAAAEAFAGQATTEVMRLSPRPTQSEVASLLARADGRLVALLVETHAELDAFLAALPAEHVCTALAVVPYDKTNLRLCPAGAPTNLDNGVRLAGCESEFWPHLRGRIPVNVATLLM